MAEKKKAETQEAEGKGFTTVSVVLRAAPGVSLLMQRMGVIKSHNVRPSTELTEADAAIMAEQFAYRQNGEGSGLYIPAVHVECATRQGARNHKLGKRAAWPIVFAAVRVSPRNIPLGVSEYNIDIQPVLNRSTGGRVLVARPEIHDWRLAFEMQVDLDLVPLALVRNSLRDGGKLDGVGTYRARYGKFVIEKWEATVPEEV